MLGGASPKVEFLKNFSTTCFAQAGGRVESVLAQPGQRVEAGLGKVVYIDLQAVYPPEDYENNSNRNQRSVKIKAELTGGGPFAVGQSLFLRLAAVRE